MPRLDRRSPSVLLTLNDTLLLIDCGEGTQFALLEYKIKVSKIRYVLLSHLHADHCMGLFGLLSTFNLQNRANPLTIIGPYGIRELLHTLCSVTNTIWKYPLELVELPADVVCHPVEELSFTVSTFPLRHKLPCIGYKVQEKRSTFSLDKRKLPEDLPGDWIGKLAKGEAVAWSDGRTLTPEEVAFPAPPRRSFAYCSDTDFDLTLSEHLLGIGTLYHEATFDDSLKDRARLTKHSTASEAAAVAKQSRVKELILGHFSSRYASVELLEQEAKNIFPRTIAAYDGFETDIMPTSID
jgi:ribonuclease Z